MLAYIPYMDPMGLDMAWLSWNRKNLLQLRMLQAVTVPAFHEEALGNRRFAQQKLPQIVSSHSSPIFWAYLLEYPIKPH